MAARSTRRKKTTSRRTSAPATTKRRSSTTPTRRRKATPTATRRKTTGTARKSSLSSTTNKRRNTQRGRAQMSASNFAVPKGTGSKPGQAQYRVDDKPHARNALSRVTQHGTPQEKRMVRRKVTQKYPSIGSGNSSTGNTGGARKNRRKKKRR